MKRVIVTPSGVELTEAEVPSPGPGEVLVRTVLAGICGSDVHAVQGRHPHIALPYRPGHEVAGTVESVGAGVTRVQEGQRVTLEPFLPCWQCKQCRAGRENLCERLGFFGCGHDQGAMAEFFTVDQRRLHLVPNALDWTQAAFIEPLGTPVHAARLAGGLAGRTVAILGAGTIALLTLQVARQQGAARVVLTARSQRSRDRAAKFGPDAVVDATAPDAVEQVRAHLGESADVVFDCVAEQSTMDQAVAIADKGGTVVVVGVPPAAVTVPLPLIQDSQLRIQGSATYLPEDFAEAIALLVSGEITVAELATVRPLESAAAAFADAASGEHVKVLLQAK
ncbi:zinc-dependent alcohol dehydrogenase [Paractinoplanes toevensis]|uniref:Alcohol dehydrogenase n=1 Tax=Paractinoplanes toevensis TaxID=571911 RepID=A0A919TGU7_9ACTN|nr:alcohol dehydrogenase catalytic domain-containing protein [Actinoplanes toevensis]GIM94150.1 alcohol dehydrogenase [Actinoplanes toevensis]